MAVSFHLTHQATRAALVELPCFLATPVDDPSLQPSLVLKAEATGCRVGLEMNHQNPWAFLISWHGNHGRGRMENM